MLAAALKLLIYFTESALETPRVDWEKRSRVPAFTYQLGEWQNKVSLMTHYIVGIYLVLVRRVLLLALVLVIIISFLMLGIACHSCEKISHVRCIGHALDSRVHVARVSQVGTTFCSSRICLCLVNEFASRRPVFRLKLEFNENLVITANPCLFYRLKSHVSLDWPLLAQPNSVLLVFLI